MLVRVCGCEGVGVHAFVYTCAGVRMCVCACVRVCVYVCM